MTRKATGLPNTCPSCEASRLSQPDLFSEGQTLCNNCADELHDRDTTMQLEETGHFSSRYHSASRLLSAEWGWGEHGHKCPECGETWSCPRSGCRPGPKDCPTCEDVAAAETVAPPAGYVDKPLSRSDLAHRDIGG